MKVLLTGGHGFVGWHLRRLIDRERPDWVVDSPPSRGVGALNVTDFSAVKAYIAESRPDLVVHLAAVSAVTSAVRAPRHAWNVNANGALNLVNALQEAPSPCRLLHVSSSEVYGKSLELDVPISEDAPLRPLNIYAATKAAGEIIASQAARSGLDAAVVRPFNHIGPGQSEAFVAPSFAAQIARIEAGLQPPVLCVGSLEEERDFLDVEDVVDSYLKLSSLSAFGPEAIYNVASGVPVRIGDLLQRLLAMSSARIKVRQDPERLRPSPLRRAVGNASRLREAVGWAPHRPLDETLRAILNEQRSAHAR